MNAHQTLTQKWKWKEKKLKAAHDHYYISLYHYSKNHKCYDKNHI